MYQVIAAANELIAVLDKHQADAPIVEHPAVTKLRVALADFLRKLYSQDSMPRIGFSKMLSPCEQTTR